MQIMKIPALNTSPVFQRKLRDNEKLEYKHDTIRQAYDFLGIKDVSLIMHGTCFPVSKNDMGVGSPFNALSKDVIEFEKLHGFTSTQLGPLGEIKRRDISPYASTVWAKNKLFIDLNALSTDEYANLISDEKLAQYAVQYNDRDRNYTYSQFYEAFENYDKVLEEAYENFVLKVRTHDTKALALNKEYSAFKNQNGQRVMKEGLFNALSQIYGTDKFEQWESEIDKNLPELLDQRNLKALDRYKYLINRNGKDIGLYCFTQFLINKQMKEHKDFRKRAGFKYNADQLVGTSKVEEYIYKDAFMKDMRMGCPSGPNGPQLWDFPVPDPNKLFKPNGTLGSAGDFIRAKLESALQDCENVRIDHVFGLVNPYVYNKNTVSYNSNGKLELNKLNAGFLSDMGLDPKGNYWKILEKIIIPIMKQYELEPDNAIWEDLGAHPPGFDELFYGKLKLSGITELSYTRAEVAREQDNKGNNWSYLGSHDSLPGIKYVKEDGKMHDPTWSFDYLSGYLNSDPARTNERKAFESKIISNPMERLKAKFADVFMSSNKIQISFADFFGINQVYNYGGQKCSTNWKLRLNENFEDAYYKNLSSDEPTAMNLPEILKIAVRAKMDRMIVNQLNTNPKEVDHFRNTINARMQPLLDRLEKYANILKEKE